MILMIQTIPSTQNFNMPIYTLECTVCDFIDERHCTFEVAKFAQCRVCDAPTRLLLSSPLIRGGDTPIHHGHTPRHLDKGFNAEWDSIYKDK